MKKLLCLLFLSFSISIKAQWFISNNGIPTVVGNVNNVTAIIDYQKDGFLGIYFYAKTGSFPCYGEKVDTIESLIINSTLVRFSRSCDGYYTYFFPSTIQGKKYIFEQFFYKNLVTIYNSRGEYVDTLSAIGFRNMNKIIMDTPKGITNGL
ncbi:hypothetical protein ACWIW6_02510 [Ursidibacter sp. B-7004-1]